MTAPDPIALDRVLKTLHTTAPALFDRHRHDIVRETPRLPRLHLILFFCQGHNLARFDRPLFTEPIVRTSRGVHVDVPAEFAAAEPSPGIGHLNTILDAASRYANLVFTDLKALVQVSQPWQDTTVGEPIDLAVLRAWFLRDAETNDVDGERPTRAEVAAAVELWARREEAVA